MTDLRVNAYVVGSEEERAAEFAAKCYANARTSRSRLFKLKNDYGPMHVHFNFSQDQIELDHNLLHLFAHSKIIEGDEIAKAWAKDGWQKLGPRVSWRMAPHAIEFALASGHRYQLRKSALFDWYADKGFPTLEEVA